MYRSRSSPKKISHSRSIATAGAGKTVLFSSIVDEIYEQNLGTCAYFYFSFKEKQAQDTRHFKYAILAQLVKSLTRPDPRIPDNHFVPAAFRSLYDKTFPSRDPKIEDLDYALKMVLEKSKEAWIAIDSLDECPSSTDQREIISYLASLSFSLGLCEEMVDQTVKEEICLLLAENLGHLCSMLMLVARVAGNEVLHVKHATKRGAFKDDGLARLVDDLTTTCVKHCARLVGDCRATNLHSFVGSSCIGSGDHCDANEGIEG